MARKYYHQRRNGHRIDLGMLYEKVSKCYLYFLSKDYFLRSGLRQGWEIEESIDKLAFIRLGFSSFPVDQWSATETTEERVFAVIEFLYDLVEEPEDRSDQISDTGFHSQGWNSFNRTGGQLAFRNLINEVLGEYAGGYQLSEIGEIELLGSDGLENILHTEVLEFDEENVDSKVRQAVAIWKNRHSGEEDRRNALKILADVFEWLRASKLLEEAMAKDDTSIIFDQINSFAIRHHSPKQKTSFSKDIWFSWMFHFYLATYHAAIRMLRNSRNQE